MAGQQAIQQRIVAYLEQRAAAGMVACSADEITQGVAVSRSTVNRHLVRLVAEGSLQKLSSGPATRYALMHRPVSGGVPGGVDRFGFSASCQPLIRALSAAMGTRRPVGYQRAWIERYVPNQSSWLPVELATELYRQGRAQGQQPAGTYARKVLEHLLIDLSWHSSRLEGNRKSLLDTQVLFERGKAEPLDVDALMLLNHKAAIEFMTDAVPEYGISTAVIRNLQSLLMDGLLADTGALGQTRHTVVNITDSVYIPLQIPQLLDEYLTLIIEKVRAIKNPVEAAFFLWLNLAYLQPFQDGNKRTSRLGANLPLLLQNCAPLSFLDVEQADYALAILAVYERQDVSLAAELFAWTYRRSIGKYAVMLDAFGAPDQFRLAYRELLGEAIRGIVVECQRMDVLITELAIPVEDQSGFMQLLHTELRTLGLHNCARYRLGMRWVERWLADGKPCE